MRLLFTKSSWEVSTLPIAEFCGRVARAGFSATETFLPTRSESPPEISAAHQATGLKLIAHIATDGATVEEHLASLRERYLFALECEPLFVNSHTGRDHFDLSANLRLFEASLELAQRHRVPIRHETHRGRAPFSAPATREFLRRLPTLELTADFSHWVCVHESDLSDQPEALETAFAATRHVHARVGFAEGPQVSDPRNPAHAEWCALFLSWWRNIVARRRAAGDAWLAITPEFGPPPYMPLAGASPQPVGDAWEYNLWMRGWLERELTAVFQDQQS